MTGLGLGGIRIIPAYAGSTCRRLVLCPCRPDHPRIRGEHTPACVGDGIRAGSSPHTRGAPIKRIRDVPRRGIIPAYAGSTRRRHRAWGRFLDHPRIRGEHAGAGRERRLPWGSSPHTRGARPDPPRCADRPGIIPAYAGSTSRRSCAGRLPWDHPRIRGEHLRQVTGKGQQHGSSPHTRGAPHDGAGVLIALRIIPAYAGSTGGVVGRGLQVEDHPRIRGEHAGFVVKLTIAGRIIPAYAGSTTSRPGRDGAETDHPRIRGEHSSR